MIQFSREQKLNNFLCVASQTGPMIIHSDAIVRAGIFTENHTQSLNSEKKYYLYIINGSVTINGTESIMGDGYSFENEAILEISDANDSEMILFELP
jgi:redox-sensitive bicupin YhaK (pirin superfamily)